MTTRTIDCTVEGVTERESNDGRSFITVEVKQERLTFSERYNCWDPTFIAIDGKRIKAKDKVALCVLRENVKADKADDGQIGSYWWLVAGVAPAGQAPAQSENVGHFRVAPSNNAQSDDRSPNVTPPPKDALQTRIEIGMAFNAAYTLLASSLPLLSPIDDPADFSTHALRVLRDRIYNEVILQPVAPAGYAYNPGGELVEVGPTAGPEETPAEEPEATLEEQLSL
jgi:hypothetical protein